MLSSLALVSLVLSLTSNAAPLDKLVSTVQKRATCTNDDGNIGTFSQPCSTYTSAVTCPNGIQGKAGGIVLLVHGTGSTGSESWSQGPYVLELPTAGPGYDVCWVDLPGRSIVDAQYSSEFVAYNVKDLAAKSSTGKVSLVSHSQGGLNVQWAMNFWSSYRALVHAFIGLAPDFHGTAQGPLACGLENLSSGGQGCNPSVIQQTVGSHYLAAANKKGDMALVPTTSLYTHYDDVIQPEVILPATSRLNGASVHAMQDLDVCGPGYVADHFTMIVSSVAYALTLDALTHDGNADPSRLTKAACFWAINDVVVLDDFNRTVALVRGAVNDVAALSFGPKVKQEPLLMPYVCSSGSASSYCSA
ncbi:esterase/lipase family protein [Sporobolomyces salmoneus]|uniref:esterase/lipase family protein n=1 Tax=Sporobolomyces salmoneus TaxID=183962 RepID=UPI0031734841